MFNFKYLKKLKNSLEHIAFSEFPKLKKIKSHLEKFDQSVFFKNDWIGFCNSLRIFNLKKKCDNAKKNFTRKYKNYWCISSKTI